MVVCKFFKEGYCRYGSNCRFEHSNTSKYSYQAPSPTTPQQASSGVTTEQIINSVKNDMSAAINGRQWLLSSYGPFSKKNFPGFEDVSPEEIRLALYNAKSNNTEDQVIASYEAMRKDATIKLGRLLNPDASILKAVTSIYKQENTPDPFANTSPFGTQSTPAKVFGAQSPANVFGGQTSPSPQSVYGHSNSPSIFSGQSTNNISGQNCASSVFGGQSSAFGAPSSLQSVFGSTSSSAQSLSAQSVFGTQSSSAQNVFGSPNTGAQNIFGGQTSPASVFSGQSTPQNVFGAQTSVTPQSVFGSYNSQSHSAPNPQSVFGSQNQNSFSKQSQSPFGQNTQAQNVFGAANSNVFSTQATVPSQSIFSQTNVHSSQNGFGNSINNNQTPDDFYSKLDELSEEYLEIYKSDTFEFGFIPELPPPQELCF